jgi:hypothetical protein
MQDLARQDDPAILVGVGIGKIDGETTLSFSTAEDRSKGRCPSIRNSRRERCRVSRWNNPPGVAPGSITSPRASNRPKVSPLFKVRGQRSWMDSVAWM